MNILDFFSMNHIMVTLLNYPLSWIEFLGTLSCLICVWLSAREKMLSWPIALINAVLFFTMFFQLQLYSDMFLQVFYFVTSIYGWILWSHPKKAEEANSCQELKISTYPSHYFLTFLMITLAISFIGGWAISHLHELLPGLFQSKAAYPYLDTIIASGSIFAQILLTKKKLESWAIWTAVDFLAVYVYFQKGVLLLTVEYAVFGCIAISGLIQWFKEFQSYSKEPLCTPDTETA